MGGDSRRVLFREARWTRRWLFSIKGLRPAVGEMPVSRSRAVTFRCRVQQRLRDACRASSRVPTARTLYLLAQLGLFFALLSTVTPGLRSARSLFQSLCTITSSSLVPAVYKARHSCNAVLIPSLGAETLSGSCSSTYVTVISISSDPCT